MSRSTKSYDFIVVGGGIFGTTAAVALAKRKHSVALINPDRIPHHLAASTDISKAVRMEYGADGEYFKMAEASIAGWKEWNNLFDQTLYHEIGFLMLCKETIDSELQSFERNSFDHLVNNGYQPEVLSSEEIASRFPALKPGYYQHAIYNKHGGFADSSLTVEQLTRYATELGVDVYQGQTVSQVIVQNGTMAGVKTKEGAVFSGGHVHIAIGSHTAQLLPELKPYLRTTGHPVFWLKPTDPVKFNSNNLAVFTADISNSGWYGFPLNEKHGVVKVARHSNGQELNPEYDDRRVTDHEVEQMRSFVKAAFPSLANAPLVFTRKCLYTDTLDGHYLIDNHPEINGLSVGTGGSGHGLKMAPILGEMQADTAESKQHQFSSRYRWRHLEPRFAEKEDARYIET